MPYHDYTCSDCNERFETWIGWKSDPNELQVCPRCGKLKGVRVLSAPNIHFKGKGFYSTDNRHEEKGSGI